MNDIRVVVMDCDGTIIKRSQEIDSNLKETIKKLRRNNVICTLASGRSYEMLRPIQEYLGIEHFVIAHNGALIRNDKDIFHELPLKEIEVYEVSKYLYQNEISFLIFNYDEVYHYDPLNKFEHYTKIFQQDKLYEFTSGKDMTHVYKISVIVDEVKLDSLVGYMRKFDNIEMVASENNIYTIVVSGVSEASAVQKLVKYLNFEMENVLSIGDNYNDIELAKIAGYSIAVLNATTEMKEVADFVCNSNEENGVSEFLNNFFEN